MFDTDGNVDYEVKLGDDGHSLVWISRTGDRERRTIEEPGPGFWQRFKVKMMRLFVPEDLL